MLSAGYQDLWFVTGIPVKLDFTNLPVSVPFVATDLFPSSSSELFKYLVLVCNHLPIVVVQVIKDQGFQLLIQNP